MSQCYLNFVIYGCKKIMSGRRRIERMPKIKFNNNKNFTVKSEKSKENTVEKCYN